MQLINAAKGLLQADKEPILNTLEQMVKKEMAESSQLRGGYEDGFMADV